MTSNQKKKNIKRSSTGYRGVRKNGKKFQAKITIESKVKCIGTFDTAIQAALAYDQAAIKAGKKKSSLNFPDGLPLPIVQQWQATINNNGSNQLLGTFNTKEEARTAVTEAKKKMNLIEGTPSRIFRLKKKE